MKTRKHYIDYFDSLITKHRDYQIGHRAVINNILRDFLDYTGQENHICKDTQNAYSQSLGSLLEWFKRSRVLSSTVARENIKKFMYPSYIETNVSNASVVTFNIINDVKRTYLEEWFSKNSKEKFTSEFSREFNNNVNMLFKHSRRLFCHGDDRTINVNVKDWVTAKFIPSSQNKSSELSVIICAPHEIYKNLPYMKPREANKHNETIRSLTYNLRMLLSKMDVVESFDDNTNYGLSLFETKVVIKLKDPSEFKPTSKPNHGNDTMKEEREYLNTRLIEVEAQIAEHTKLLKALNAKANGLRNAIEVLK
nr:Thioredoxin, phage-associated [Escherichia phage vB_Eco_QOTSP]